MPVPGFCQAFGGPWNPGCSPPGPRLIDNHRTLPALGPVRLRGSRLVPRKPCPAGRPPKPCPGICPGLGPGLTIIGKAGCWRRHSPPPGRGGGGSPTMRPAAARGSGVAAVPPDRHRKGAPARRRPAAARRRSPSCESRTADRRRRTTGAAFAAHRTRTSRPDSAAYRSSRLPANSPAAHGARPALHGARGSSPRYAANRGFSDIAGHFDVGRQSSCSIATA